MAIRVLERDDVGRHGAGAVPARSPFLASDRAYYSVLCALGFGTGALAMLHLGRAPLWRDEAWTYTIVRLPLSGMLRDLLHRDVNMALYYLVARLWLVFGSSDAWLRSLSVLFAALAVVVTAATVGRILDRRAAVVAGVLLATNPFFVDYAREARAYSLVVLLTSCSWYLLVRGWWNGSTRWRAAYGLCLLALAATQVVALLVVPVQVATLVVARRVSRRTSWLYGLAGLLPAAMLFVYVLLNNRSQTAWIPRPDLAVLHQFLASIVGSDRWIVLYTALIGLGIVVAIRRGHPTDRLVVLVALVGFVAPVVAVWTVSHVRPLFVDHYLIFVLPSFVVLAAYAVTRAPRRTVLLVLIVVGLTAHSLHKDEPILSRRVHGEDIRAAVRQLASEGRSNDALLFDPSWARPGFEHFSASTPVLPRDVALAPGGRRPDMVLARERTPADIEARLGGVDRVWVVGYARDDWPIAPDPAAAVRAAHAGRDWVQAEQRTYGQFLVTLYEVKPG